MVTAPGQPEGPGIGETSAQSTGSQRNPATRASIFCGLQATDGRLTSSHEGTRTMKKKIVITSFGSFGDVFPYIGLALGLRDRGHHVVLAMPAFYRERVEAEGVDFHPVRPDVDPTDRETVRRIMDSARGTEYIVRELIMGSLRASYDDLSGASRGADLLVTHPITFAGPILAQVQGLSWVSTVLAPMSFFSAHDLPVFPPAPGLKRLERVPGASAALVAMARLSSRGWGRQVYRFRRELGLDHGGHPVFEGQHSPALVLALFSRVLAEPQPDWPPNVVVTGAIPYNGAGSEAQLSPELQEFLRDGAPPVVFTLGSSAVGAAGDFYEESLQAIRRLEIRAVLLVGPHAENRPRTSLPDGVMLVPFAPHAKLFRQAAVVVHQGGAGTLHQGLRSGRPTLVVPFAHDQPDNAWRAERLGVSRTVPARSYTARSAAREIARLLSDERIRARAEEVADQVRAEDGVGAACDAIERIISPSTARGSPPQRQGLAGA
jgi:rhamnosyltransferase subunit B